MERTELISILQLLNPERWFSHSAIEMWHHSDLKPGFGFVFVVSFLTNASHANCSSLCPAEPTFLCLEDARVECGSIDFHKTAWGLFQHLHN